MEIQETLKTIGLTPGEQKIYLALLKIGASPVHKIKIETGTHRTTIYDFLDKLQKKGLVSSVIKGGTQFFKAAPTAKLLDYVKNIEHSIKEILPKLEELEANPKTDIHVEVYKGKEGIKTILHDMINTKANPKWLGVDEAQFNKILSETTIKQHIRRQKEQGIKEQIITSENTTEIYETPTATYKYMENEYFEPTPTVIYANRVVNIIWEPLSAIMIINEALAKSYTKYFQQLWEIAKKETKKKVKKISLP